MKLEMLSITKRKQELLVEMGINDIESLLSHYPFRYEENVCTPFSTWNKEDRVCFEAIVVRSAKVTRYGYKKSYTKCKVMYEDVELEIVLFNRPWTSAFQIGKVLTFFGKYDGNYKVVCTQFNSQPIQEQMGIQPVYNVKDKITQKEMRKWMKEALTIYQAEDIIPIAYRKKYRLIPRVDALIHIHEPRNKEALKQALRMLKYEEFLKFQLLMQYMKATQEKQIGIAKQFDQKKIDIFVSSLPFVLSNGQQSAICDVLEDLQSEKVMYRLIQGDVGCGKTMVAMIAMYACVLSKQQCALMAPTEILAKQHYQNIKKAFASHSITVEVLYSSLPKKEKTQLLERLSNGDVDILIGTHALFQNDVVYNNLGLVVADEQHRFGVKQRRTLLEKGTQVDFLLMSATPIPRTLAVSLFGDMDVSTIEELPQGRKTIICEYIKEDSMRTILESVLTKIDEGHQCYIVCPAIEKNEEYAMRNVEELYANINGVLGKKYALGLLHGKMNSEQKEQVMEDFIQKKYQILIATTVIEVGVDVKDANIMIIYDAHRFGMSQIHQLRGRVGRGSEQGYCYLLSATEDEDTQKRLAIVASTTDGFSIAKQDLAIRGPGDLLGIRQSGVSGFILGDVIADESILEVARNDAKEIMLDLDKYKEIQQFIIKKDYTSYLD